MLYHVEIKNDIGKSCDVIINQITGANRNWLNTICIYFVLEGEINILTKTMNEKLGENDLLLINSFTAHEIKSESDNIVYCLQINPKYYNNFYNNFSNLRFDLNSSKCEIYEKENIAIIKHVMSKIIQIIEFKEKSFLISAEQYLHELIKLLLNKYVRHESSTENLIHDEEKRLFRILDYIDSNYKEHLTLNDFSEREHLNSQYFSRFFSKSMGITLKSYIFKVRLEKSLEELVHTPKKISSIALDNGFSDFKSYFKEFKKEYNITPAKYRSQNKIKSPIPLFQGKHKLIESTENIMKKLQPYLDILSISNDFLNFQLVNVPGRLPESKDTCYINYKQSIGVLNRSWQKVARCDRAIDTLTSRWRHEFEDIQKSINFEYLLIRNIFCNEMMIYQGDTQCGYKYNFDLIDEIINYLLSINIVPFIEIGFIPEELSQKKVFEYPWKSNVGYPNDLAEWGQLVCNFFTHLFENYNIENLKTWRFQLWYNPDWEKSSNVNLINNFLKTTSDAIVKSNINYKHLKIGLIYFYNSESKKTMNLDSYNFNALPLSFISVSLRDLFFTKQDINNNNNYVSQNTICKRFFIDDDISNEAFMDIKDNLSKAGFSNNEIYVLDWNGYWGHKDFLNDTCFKSSFLIKRILKYYENTTLIVDSLFPHEISNMLPAFNGDNSLITRIGLKKASYYAYLLLNMMGEKILKKGNDFLVTKKKNGSLQILTQNYCSISENAVINDTLKIDLHERYHVFDVKSGIVNFIIQGLSGKVKINTYRINREYGSVYDQWINMGSPPKLNDAELQLLKNKSLYDYKTKVIETIENISINEKMKPHEILLIEICPI